MIKPNETPIIKFTRLSEVIPDTNSCKGLLSTVSEEMIIKDLKIISSSLADKINLLQNFNLNINKLSEAEKLINSFIIMK